MNALYKFGFASLVSFAVSSSATAAVVNVAYEFDTPEKQALWNVTATERWTGFTPAPSFYVNGVTYAGTQNAAENNWGRTGTLELVTRIDAPAGEVFTAIQASADASGFAGWNYSSNIQLSSDGVNFSIVSATPNTVDGTETVTAVATGQPGFTNLTSVWLKVRLFDELGYFDGANRYARVENITFQGETQPVPEPTATIAVLGVALGLMRRRCRKIGG